MSTQAWRTPRCPAGYYECAGCCDRDADCACDGACDLGVDADCALAYGAGGAKPDGWCPVGYSDCSSRGGGDNDRGGFNSDCCSWGAPPPDWAWASVGTIGFNPHDYGACSGNAGVGVPAPPQDFPEATWQNRKEKERAHREFTSRWLSRCLRAAGAVSREWCGAGPRELGGWDEFLPDFECSVRKAASGAGAGACCAGPNETAACADGYAVVAGNAPCVFTCCRDATNVTAADVDAEGFCWEAHANEGRRPPARDECCDDETDACPGGEQKVYVLGDWNHWSTYETHCCPRASAPAACFERKRRADCVEDACRTSDIRRRRRYRDRPTPTSAQVQARRPGHTE